MTLDRLVRLQTLRWGVILAALSLAGAASAVDLSGTWAGTWEDDGSGHAGPLKARITRNCDGSYHCAFHGRFAKIIPFCYKTDLEVVEECDDWVHMHGVSRLPIFGDFHYDAVADDCNFELHFCSKRYTGTFTMSRRSWFLCQE